MIIRKPGAKFTYEGNTYAVGAQIIGTEESEYEGLYGSIIEIRDGEDKDTDNATPDIYCCFEAPALPSAIEKLESIFSDLYDEPKTIEDICLDEVIMAPSMIRVLDDAEAALNIRMYRVVEDWAINGETDASEAQFTDPDQAKYCFSKKLSNEANDGCVLQLREMTGFTEVEEGEFQYAAFIEGEYCLNHYEIKLYATELQVGLTQLREMGHAHNDAVHSERFLIAAAQDTSTEELTDEQFEKMLNDPEIPALIRSKLEASKAYDAEYIDVVNEVVCDLVEKYLNAQMGHEGECDRGKRSEKHD